MVCSVVVVGVRAANDLDLDLDTTGDSGSLLSRTFDLDSTGVPGFLLRQALVSAAPVGDKKKKKATRT
ncbi:hypothetical protein E2C01_070901 [Portunus trituberculatus]|uniref:Uncharacterized protein n=1 Tax=Portunus trituberculatus TaxID=210409 RepID=A0A5B7I4V0_PORTR|nr:hypothetical protein [Portunus trituberculatus]